MSRSILWIALCIVFAVVSYLLYVTIDKPSIVASGSTVLVTIAFFASATVTILCGFKAADSGDVVQKH